MLSTSLDFGLSLLANFILFCSFLFSCCSSLNPTFFCIISDGSGHQYVAIPLPPSTTDLIHSSKNSSDDTSVRRTNGEKVQRISSKRTSPAITIKEELEWTQRRRDIIIKSNALCIAMYSCVFKISKIDM